MRARIVSVLLALVATVVGLLGLAAPASAHDQLLSSVPADAETLTEAPSDLVLTFSADIAAIGSEALVLAPDGSDVVAAPPVAQGTIVTVPLAAELASGTYQVTWRVTSSDGHPIDGTFTFTLDLLQPTTAQPASPSSSPSAQASPVESVEAATTAASAAGATADDPSTGATADDPSATAESGLTTGDVSSLPGWVMAILAVGIVATIVALLVRLRASSRLRE